MKLQFEDRISEIADKARDRYEDAISAARSRTEKAAGRVTKGKKPVKAVSRLGVRLSGVSHRTANKLWKRQTKLVEDQIDALAGRLKAAAAAPDLKKLVKTQIQLIPDNASRLQVEARETFEIIKGAGGEIRDIVKESVDEFRGRKPAARKTPRARKPAVAKPPMATTPPVVGDGIAA
jgi:phasin family protein